MNPAYRLVAIDMDGTLLNDEKTIPEKNIAALKKAAEAGVYIMVATGRPYRAAQWVLEHIGIEEGLILAQGGNIVCRYPTEEAIFCGAHETSFLLEVAEFCFEQDLFFHCMVGSEYHYPVFKPEAAVPERYFGYPGILRPLDEIAKSKPGRITIIRAAEEVEGLIAQVRARFGGRAEIVRGGPEIIELTPPGIDKGTTLLRTAELLGIGQQEIIAIGDSENDLAMVKAAGLGVSMLNGSGEIKAAADYITPMDNNESGVAHVVEKFILEPMGL